MPYDPHHNREQKTVIPYLPWFFHTLPDIRNTLFDLCFIAVCKQKCKFISAKAVYMILRPDLIEKITDIFQKFITLLLPACIIYLTEVPKRDNDKHKLLLR